MKAYWINATEQTVSEVEYTGIADLQRMVGGYIEVAVQWPSGDVLFVDEEGLLKGPSVGFRIPERTDQPLAGNGVLVGREIGDTANTEPPKMPLEQLRVRVMFLRFR